MSNYSLLLLVNQIQRLLPVQLQTLLKHSHYRLIAIGQEIPHLYQLPGEDFINTAVVVIVAVVVVDFDVVADVESED
jgi:NADPH-dependent glutamate synthase beta subunit-like oxidoreductase